MAQNIFAMKRENQGFLPFAQNFERFIQALLDKNLPQVLQESIALGEAELKKADEGREYIAQAVTLRAEIDSLHASATAKHDEAQAVLTRANTTETELKERVASEEERLKNWHQTLTIRENELNNRHAGQEGRHSSLTVAENKLQETQKAADNANLQKEIAIKAREDRLAKEKADFDDYQQKFRERAAAAQAALRG